jgi:hypothetical protein
MGLLINNDLIWISIPKCASSSIESALLNSNLDIKKHYLHKINPESHLHLELNVLYKDFGKKETICINRDPLERWISSLETIWEVFKYKNQSIKVDFNNIDNEFLYKTFNIHFLNNLHSGQIEMCNFSFINNYKLQKENDSILIAICKLLLSQNYWKKNIKCTYEFEINKLDELKQFFKQKYNEEIIIPHINPNEVIYNRKEKTKNKIIVDDKLKNWYDKSFEKPFEKRNCLI